MSFFRFLASLVRSAVVLFCRPAAPSAPVATPAVPGEPSKPSVALTLERIILSETESIGPMPRTGGVIHAVDAAEAKIVAAALIDAAHAHGLAVSLLAGYARTESDFDPHADDPNWQDRQPNETAADAFRHDDVGEAQIDGAGLLLMPEFRGKTILQIRAAADDPAWAFEHMAQIIISDREQLDVAFLADPSLVAKIPNGDKRIAYANSYNAGVHGTINALRSATPKLAYGSKVVARADGWASLLGDARP